MSTDIGNSVERVCASYEADFVFIVDNIARGAAEICESPIEVMLATAFVVGNRLCGDKFFELVYPGKQPEGVALTNVFLQYEWEGYRIDFFLETPKFGLKVFVECDGHDFHERTPAQAERDRKKDRLAQEHGISILRFTGREIFRSPADCVAQIMKFQSERARGGK